MRELEYALRRLRGSPMFTIAATLTLTIAIGATASVFGLVDGVVLKAFPYRDPGEILWISESNPKLDQPQGPVSPLDYLDFQSQSTAFSGLAAATGHPVTLNQERAPERARGFDVTPNYFAVLGISPVLGRPLSAEPGAPPEALISYGYWQRRFGGNRSVLGQSLSIDGQPTTIVGVMPPGVQPQGELWTRSTFGGDDLTDRDARHLWVFGRLKPGVTADAAERQLQGIAQRLAQAYPQTNTDWSVVSDRFLDDIIGWLTRVLVLLLGAALSVLLIGAANLANLFLVRCVSREREMAVRNALGATRGRLVRELLAESAMLAFFAGTLGVAAAVVGVGVLRALAPAEFPRLAQVHVDGRVVAFCALTSVTTVFVFGLLPAWQTSRSSIADFLRDGARSTTSGQQRRIQDGLVVVQIAVALTLLTAASLLVQNLQDNLRTDTGFRPEGVLTAEIGIPIQRYPTAERQASLIASVIEGLSAQAGVRSASASSEIPRSGYLYLSGFAIEGDPTPDPDHTPSASIVAVTPAYFETMGIAVRRGRGVLSVDDQRSAKVAVIDEVLARRFFGGRDPVGRHLVLSTKADTLEIVGVVSAVMEGGLLTKARPQLYVPFAQSPAWDARNFLETNFAAIEVLGRGGVGVGTTALLHAINGVDRTIQVGEVGSLSDRLTDSLRLERFASFLASLFALIALTLGVVGIYSVLSYIVAQRRRDIALRLALGASQARLMSDVLRRAAGLTGIGLAFGGLGAFWAARFVGRLFQLDPAGHHGVAFAGPVVLFSAVALMGASVPAFRTTRVNPVVALNST